MSQNFKTEHRKNVNGKNHFEISTEFIVERKHYAKCQILCFFGNSDFRVC